VNPHTGKSSAIEYEFSAHNWNARTLRHLKDIRALGEERFNQLFEIAFNGSKHGRVRPAANFDPTSNNSNDDLHSDETLQSEDDDEGDKAAHVENNVVQGNEDSESLFIC
jgi:hypothetical protein